jgi:hypothetical protein
LNIIIAVIIIIFGYICRLTLPRIIAGNQAWEPIICHPTPHSRDMLRQTEMYIYQGIYCKILNWEIQSKTCFSCPTSKTLNLSQICYLENFLLYYIWLHFCTKYSDC